MTVCVYNLKLWFAYVTFCTGARFTCLLTQIKVAGGAIVRDWWRCRLFMEPVPKSFLRERTKIIKKIILEIKIVY